MTNEMIIMAHQLALMEQGKIGTTGRTLILKNDDGTSSEVPEPEPIHTFAYWKALGYRVRKGEHAIARIGIWKHKGKTETTDDGEEIDMSRMFMKTAHFFSASQVEKEATNATV